MKLTLGFSTLKNNYIGLVNYLQKLNLDERFEVLVVVQGFEFSSKEEVTEGSVITLVKDASIGLSISRNLVLEYAEGDIVWFLDDDVAISKEYLENLYSALKARRSDVYIGQIECSDCEGMYKKYGSNSSRLLMALRASSIEVLVRRDFLVKSRIKFDPELGLGAEYPSGEENAFLADLWRFGAKFENLGIPIVKHPCLIESRSPRIKWKKPKILMARGKVARRFGWVSPFILLYFFVQTVAITKSVGGLQRLLSGYLND
ncbi:MAG: glycosyltransferase involved in cell wall biosynthesis [Pseudomonadales bacterium]|jgi:glycosyltransferase involved in cell wall biosynthesis